MLGTMDGPTRRDDPAPAADPPWISLVLALPLVFLGAFGLACTAVEGRALLLGDDSGEAPPPPVAAVSAAAADPTVVAASSAPAPLPDLLSQTGLYAARGAAGAPGSGAAAGAQELHPDVFQFVPQYPLWTDGATKRRYVRLPPGTSIDASKPDAWVFPVGTRFWKDFAFPDEGGAHAGSSAPRSGAPRKVETRLIERLADGSWRFASYVWDADGREARLVPEGGLPNAAPIGETGRLHDIPSRGDCLACHEGAGARAPILGFTALQLSPDRDALAPHAEVKAADAIDLEGLVRRGLLEGYVGPARPGIVAESPEARASLGYLHGNCSGCHNRGGPLADLGLDFEQTGRPGDAERVLSSVVGVESRFRLPGEQHSVRVSAGEPLESVLRFRIGTRNIVQQMPPLGSKVVDQEATELVASWIESIVNEAPTSAEKETP